MITAGNTVDCRQSASCAMTWSVKMRFLENPPCPCSPKQCRARHCDKWALIMGGEEDVRVAVAIEVGHNG